MGRGSQRTSGKLKPKFGDLAVRREMAAGYVLLPGAFERAWRRESHEKIKSQGCEWKADVLVPHPNSKCCLSATSKPSIYSQGQRLGDACPRQSHNSGDHGATSAVLPGTQVTYPGFHSAATMQLCATFLYPAPRDGAVAPNLKAAPGWH